MSVTSTIKAMRAVGISDSQIVDAVLAMDEERLAKGRARTAKSRNNKKNADVTRVTCVTPPSPSPKKEKSPHTPLKEKITPTPPPEGAAPKTGADPLPADFLEFWTIWRSIKGGGSRKPTFKAWSKLSDEEKAEARHHAAPWFQAWRRSNRDASAIHASTFINGTLWTDYPQEQPTNGNGNGNGQKKQSRADQFKDAIARKYGSCENQNGQAGESPYVDGFFSGTTIDGRPN